jgi:hypothetical protein
VETVGNILRIVLVLGTIVVFYVLFPLWAARYAKQRGRDRLATISKVSIFILMGPLGALIALIGSMSHPPLGQAQRPCPECSSTEVKAEMHTLDAASGKDLGTPLQRGVNSVGGILFGGMGLFLAWGVYTEFLEWAGLTGPVPALILAGLGLASLVSGILSLVAYYRKDNPRQLQLACKSCKHEWHETVGSTAA